ncbi:MAG: ABC transporter ATP-binding protein [Actinomycetota bacterium]
MSDDTVPASRFATDDSLSATATVFRGLALVPVLRRGLGITILLAALGAGGRVVVPVLIQQAIDRGIVGFDEVQIGVVVQLSVVGAVAILLSGLALRWAALRLGDRSERALYDLRTRLIAHIHRLSLADHGEERRGGLVARVTSDIETLAQFFQWGGMAWMRNTTLMLVIGVTMLVYDWQLALVAFAVALPLAFVLRAVQRRLVRAHGRARERNGEMLGALAEIVTGAVPLRSYDAAGHVADTVREATGRKRRDQVRAAIIGAFLFPSGEVFSVLTVSAVVSVGVWRGPSGGLTAGAVVGFVFLTYRFLEPIAEFTEVIDQTQTAVAGMRRILTVLALDVQPPPPDPDSAIALPAGALSVGVDDVTFTYRPRQSDTVASGPALSDVTFHVPAGQSVALVGATGSGKTTLGKLFARFADPDTGTVRVGGVDLRSVDDADLRRRLLIVSQEPFLFDETIRSNVAFAAPDRGPAAVDEVVERLSLGAWVSSLNEGLDTRVGERGDSLSAGERQLVALLRAGLVDPDVLILDEATSSVDALTEVHIARALERLATDRTSIAIAHRLSTAARADRVLVLAEGRLVQDGPHSELVAQDGPYRSMYDDWISATTV